MITNDCKQTDVNYLLQSTGDSLDDEDDEELLEAKKNTSYNEVIDADNPQTPAEVCSSKMHETFELYFLVIHAKCAK